MSIKVVGIVLERDGVRTNAYPVTPDELKEAKEFLSEKGLNIDECECGTEECYNGYIWACSRGEDGVCRWYKSDWGCN